MPTFTEEPDVKTLTEYQAKQDALELALQLASQRKLNSYTSSSSYSYNVNVDDVIADAKKILKWTTAGIDFQ